MNRKRKNQSQTSLRSYIGRVVLARQAVTLIVTLIFLSAGFAVSLNLYWSQLGKQSDGLAWSMDQFMDGNLDLAKVVSGYVKTDADLQTLVAGYAYIESAFIIGADKKLLASAPHDTRYFRGMDMSGNYLWKAGDPSHFSSFHRSLKTEEPSIALSFPLARGGWLNLELNLMRIEEELAHFRSGEPGMSYVCDATGAYIVHPEFAKVEAHMYSPYSVKLEKSAQPELVFKDGSLFLMRAIRLVDMNAWLITETNVLTLLEPYFVSMLALIVLLVSIGVYFAIRQKASLIRNIAVPLAELDELSSQIAENKLDQLPELMRASRITEIHDLRASFATMMHRLVEQRSSLEQTMTDLERQTSDLQSFTYAVSHDLRSPLVIIKGFLPYLKGAFDSKDEKGFTDDLSRINSAANTIDAHLQDLLALSRIGHVKAETTVESLSDMAFAAADILEPCWKNGIPRPIIADNLPRVTVHKHQIIEVFQNLFENAWKYRDPNRLLHITVTRLDDGSIQVEDNGIGFDPAWREKIFDVFQRLHVEVPGNGMGLAIVRRVLRMHGGEIRAESDGPGKGARFIFTIKGLPGPGSSN